MADPKDYDDELDDLDKYLDEFDDDVELASKPTTASKTSTGSSKQTEPANAPVDTKEDPEEEALLKEMINKLNLMSESTTNENNQEADFADLKKMQDKLSKFLEGDDITQTQTEVDQLLQGLLNGASVASNDQHTTQSSAKDTQSSSSSSAKPEKKSLQDTINETMKRMKESKQEIDESVKNDANNEDELLAKILKDLEATAGGGDGDGMDMSKLLTDMLHQMASKEILYEPMKEMDEKYPAWINDNSSKVSVEDKTRYLNQHKTIHEIVTMFERPDYSDDNAEHKEYITTRMELIQESGAPPSDLMSEVSSSALPGFDMGDFDPTKLPDLPDLDGCNTQ